MIGILLALAIQGPFATSECKYRNNDNSSNITSQSAVTNELSFWESEKYVIFAIILTVIYIIGNIMLIVFVKEKNSKFKIRNAIVTLPNY